MKVFRYILLVLLAYSLPFNVYGEEQNGHVTNNLQGMTVFQNENGEFHVKMMFENLPDKKYNLKPIGNNTYILPLPNQNGEKNKFTYVGNNTYIMLLPNARASISENDIVYQNGKENINVSMQENQDVTNPENISTKITFQTKDNSSVKVSAYTSSTGEQKPENTENSNNQENLENAQQEQNEQNEINNENNENFENTENNQNNYNSFLESNSRTLSPFDWFCYILTLILGIICLYFIRKQTSATKKKKNKKKHRKSAAVKISTYDEEISVTAKNNFYNEITPPSETYSFDNEYKSQFEKSKNTSQPVSYNSTPSSGTISEPTQQTSGESTLLVLDSPKIETLTNNSSNYQMQEAKEDDLSFFDIENEDENLPDVGADALPPEEGDQNNDLNNDLTFFELDNEKIDTNNTELQIEINDTSAFDINESTNFNNYDDFSLIDIDDENISSTGIEEKPDFIQEETITEPQNSEEESAINNINFLDNTENDEETINEQNQEDSYNIINSYNSLNSDENEEFTILDESDSDDDMIIDNNNNDSYFQINDISQQVSNDNNYEENSEDDINNIINDFDAEEDFSLAYSTEDNKDSIIEENNENSYLNTDNYLQKDLIENEEVVYADNDNEINEENNTIIDNSNNDSINDIQSNISENNDAEFLSETLQNEKYNSADIEVEENSITEETDNLNLYQRNLQYIQEIGNIKSEQNHNTRFFDNTNRDNYPEQREQSENIDNLVIFSNTNIEETVIEEEVVAVEEAETRTETEAREEEVLTEEILTTSAESDIIKDKISFEDNTQQNQEQNQENDLNQKYENLTDAYRKVLAAIHNEKSEKHPEIIDNFAINNSKGFCLVKYGSKVSIVGNIEEKLFVLKTFEPEQIGTEPLFMEFCTQSNASAIYSIILNNFKALAKVTDNEISLIGEYA